MLRPHVPMLCKETTAVADSQRCCFACCAPQTRPTRKHSVVVLTNYDPFHSHAAKKPHSVSSSCRASVGMAHSYVNAQFILFGGVVGSMLRPFAFRHCRKATTADDCSCIQDYVVCCQVRPTNMFANARLDAKHIIHNNLKT